MNKYIQNLKIKESSPVSKAKRGRFGLSSGGVSTSLSMGVLATYVTISWEKFYFQILSFKEVIKIIYKNIERSSENLLMNLKVTF